MGAGALIDLVEQAVLVGGLDFWSFGKGRTVIHEPRLRDALAERLKAAGRDFISRTPSSSRPRETCARRRPRSGFRFSRCRGGSFARTFAAAPSCGATVSTSRESAIAISAIGARARSRFRFVSSARASGGTSRSSPGSGSPIGRRSSLPVAEPSTSRGRHRRLLGGRHRVRVPREGAAFGRAHTRHQSEVHGRPSLARYGRERGVRREAPPPRPHRVERLFPAGRERALDSREGRELEKAVARYGTS